jgi:hypothetical protein
MQPSAYMHEKPLGFLFDKGDRHFYSPGLKKIGAEKRYETPVFPISNQDL